MAGRDELAVTARGLTKRFGAFTAVRSVSFDVPVGNIYGFLGPNGAGKSTTIRMLCGLLVPTEGEATVSGFDVRRQADEIKANIGYMSQKFSLYNDLTVVQNIDFYAGIYDLDRARTRTRRAWALSMAGLEGKERMLTANLSGGWKQRLSLACSILHEPKIVFLDEPTAGVDPISRRDFWDLIHRFSSEGVTVFVTTHYMDEAEHCHRLAMIYAGEKIAEGTPEQFKDDVIREDVVSIEAESMIAARPIVEAMPEASAVRVFGDSLRANAKDADALLARLPVVFAEAGQTLVRAERVDKSLEDAFIEVIARHDRAKTAGGGEAA